MVCIMKAAMQQPASAASSSREDLGMRVPVHGHRLTATR